VFIRSTADAAWPQVDMIKTIDKVGQLLWAWFSCQRNSADEIVEP